MKTKRIRKLTNKEMEKLIQELQYRHMLLQTQLENMIEAFSEFLSFSGNKEKFMKHLESLTEKRKEVASETQATGDEVI